MEVLVLDYLINQTQNRNMPPNILKLIYNEYRNLAKQEKLGENSLMSYLRKLNDGRHMAGAEHIFKYRLSSGDRILYTYGRFMPCIRDDKKDSLVLIGYTNHDKQGAFALHFDLNKKRMYQNVSEIVKDMDEAGWDELENEGFSEDDIYAIAELLSERNLTRYHAIYVTTDDTLLSSAPDVYEKYLSSEQAKILNLFCNKLAPTFIQGGAGTGKTLIAVHALNDYACTNPDNRIIYFTQSNELLKKTKSIYTQLNPYDKKIESEFAEINSFCIDYLDMEMQKYKSTQQFYTFIYSREDLYKLCIDNELEPADVWTEIRGTIKGSMSHDWQRYKPILQDILGKSVTSLVTKGYFVRQKDKKFILLSDNVANTKERFQNDTSLDKDEIKTLNRAINYFSSFDYTIVSIDEENYYRLSIEEATLPKEKRQIVWKIFESYQDYLEANDYYDDNDLIRMMFEKQNINKDFPQFDLIIVDEVQDYTELQIFFLKKLSKDDTNNILLVGDVNQNVNPTYFNEKKLQSLFWDKENNLSLNYYHLAQNFRCQRYVVEAANRISELRREKIGNNSGEAEQPETFLRQGNPLMRLKYSKENIGLMISEIIKYPSTAILVLNTNERNKVIEIAELSEFNSIDTHIFTVNEIKGMEFEYVVCFNLISACFEAWQHIVYGQSIKHQTNFRLFFNLLYVAVTRAENNLCFIDEKSINGIENMLCLENIEKYDRDTLYINTISNSRISQINAAKAFYEAGKYKEALISFMQIEEHDREIKEYIFKCKMSLADIEQNYAKAASYSFILNNIDDTEKYLRAHNDDNSAISRLFTVYKNLHYYNTTGRNIDDASIKNIIDMCYSERNEREIIQKIMLNEYSDSLLTLADSIEQTINSFTGEIKNGC